jgi:hypothetical protein
MRIKTVENQLRVRTQMKVGWDWCPNVCEGAHLDRVMAGQDPKESLCERHKCLLTCTDAWYSGYYEKYC